MYKEVPIIIVFCYLIGELYKIVFKKSKHKFIPIVLPIIGGIISVIMYYAQTANTSINNNLYEFILMGIVSGASSTGTNEIIKKIFKKDQIK